LFEHALPHATDSVSQAQPVTTKNLSLPAFPPSC